MSQSVVGLRTGMRVCGVQVLRGPHVFSNLPMVRIDLDLGTLEQFPTDRLPGFVGSLLAYLPGLERHGCSYGVAGGFVSRLRQGTWLGHVAEHIALELQTITGTRVTRSKSRSAKGQPGRLHVMFTFVDEAVGRAAGRLAGRRRLFLCYSANIPC